MVWQEEWTTDALNGTGRDLLDERPTAYRLGRLEEVRDRFDEARDRLSLSLETLTEADLDREFGYFGSPVTLRRVLRTHTTHLAGSRYHIRYVRGTYSRERRTDESVFDPW